MSLLLALVMLLTLVSCGNSASKSEAENSETKKAETEYVEKQSEKELQNIPEEVTGFWKDDGSGTIYCFVGNEGMRIYEAPDELADISKYVAFFTVENDEGGLLLTFNDRTSCAVNATGHSIIVDSETPETLLPVAMEDGLDTCAARIEEQAEYCGYIWMTQMEMNMGSYAVYRHWEILVKAEIACLAETLDETERAELYCQFETWQAEVAAAAEEAAAEYEGGSIMPLIRSSTRIKKYSEKYSQLREQIH